MSDSFSVFGTQHVITIAVIVAAMVALPVFVRRAGPKTKAGVAAMLGSVLLLAKLIEPVIRISSGEPWQPQLPLQLCDVGALAIGVFMLQRRSETLFLLGYFWGLGGGLQAILTPDLRSAFPSVDYLFFFLTHGLCMVCAVYAIVVFGRRPNFVSVFRVFLLTLVYAAVMFPMNHVLGTNFLYLLRKPAGASLIDYLGPWPWYLASLFGVALAFFLIYYAPFALINRLGKRRP